MSSNDMLHFYIDRKKSVLGVPTSYALPIANPNSNPTTPTSLTNMGNARPLFSPTGAVSPPHPGEWEVWVNSTVGSRYEIGDGGGAVWRWRLVFEDVRGRC